MKVKCIKEYIAKCGSSETKFEVGSYYDSQQPCIGLSGSCIDMRFTNGILLHSQDKYFEVYTFIDNEPVINLNATDKLYSNYGYYTSPYKFKQDYES